MQPQLLIFELESAGHHPGYLRHLLRYWPDANTHLCIVVSPEFTTRHPDIVQMPTEAQVTWQPITPQERQWYEASKRSLLRRTWAEWRLYCRYAQKVAADQGLVMYIDRFQLPMALRLFLPCPTSGIFFRPKFHYQQFAKHQPTRSEQVRSLRERWLWRSALGHSQLKTLFSLDPLAVEPLRTLGRNANVIALPDPVEWYTPATAADTTLRQALGIEPGRKVLLLFGMIDRRKGVYQVLEALQQLPASEQARLTLLLVGPVAEADRAAVTTTVDVLRCESSLQIVLCDRFIADAEIQPYFALADLVLALYQRHVGMSAILVRAAAAGKPVLASEHGLMGEIVRRCKLGVVVNSADIHQVAKALINTLQARDNGFDPTMAATFAQNNSAAAFAAVIQGQLQLCLESN